MAFTNVVLIRARLPAALLLGAWLLSACASQPPEPERVGGEPERDERFQPSALPGGPVTPNPYTAGAPPVARDLQRDFERALEQLEAERWDRARSLLEDLTERAPQLSGPWVNLASIHRAQGRDQQARQALERAIALNPDNLEAYNHLALLQREAGAFDRAEQLYRQALAIWPYHDISHRNLGILLDLYRGEGEQALLHYRAYQQLQDEPEREMTGWIMDLERRLDREEN